MSTSSTYSSSGTRTNAIELEPLEPEPVVIVDPSQADIIPSEVPTGPNLISTESNVSCNQRTSVVVIKPENNQYYQPTSTAVIGGESNAYYPPEHRRSTVGELNLSERSCLENLFNIFGILCAITAMGLDIAEWFEGSDESVGVTLIVFFGGIISLLINIVDYATGDCELIRKYLMILTCLWWCKSIESCKDIYDKISIKLLMFFNFVIWVVLFYYDCIEFGEKVQNAMDADQDTEYGFATEESEGSDSRDILSMIIFAADTLPLQLKMIKMFASGSGVIVSIISFIFRLIAKLIVIICKILCCLCCCGLVIFVISAIIGFFVAANSGGE